MEYFICGADSEKKQNIYGIEANSEDEAVEMIKGLDVNPQTVVACPGWQFEGKAVPIPEELISMLAIDQGEEGGINPSTGYLVEGICSAGNNKKLWVEADSKKAAAKAVKDQGMLPAVITKSEVKYLFTIEYKEQHDEWVGFSGSDEDTEEEQVSLTSDDSKLKEEKWQDDAVPFLVKSYYGTFPGVIQAYKKDIKNLADEGYRPILKEWVPEPVSVGAFIGILFLCLIIIGWFVLLYLLVNKGTEGALVVTYELQ